MARKKPTQYKQQSIVSGKSISDIMQMDVSKLSKPDLQKVVGRLVSAGNKRLRSFEKTGTKSPSYTEVMNNGGRFSTKGKNVNQLRTEFMRASTFLKSEIGSVSKWKRVQKETIKTLQKEQGVSISIDNFDLVFQLYEKLKKVDKSIENKLYKYSTLSDINEMINSSMSMDEIMLKMESRIQEIYEETQDMIGDVGNVSQFIEI